MTGMRRPSQVRNVNSRGGRGRDGASASTRLRSRATFRPRRRLVSSSQASSWRGSVQSAGVARPTASAEATPSRDSAKGFRPVTVRSWSRVMIATGADSTRERRNSSCRPRKRFDSARRSRVSRSSISERTMALPRSWTARATSPSSGEAGKARPSGLSRASMARAIPTTVPTSPARPRWMRKPSTAPPTRAATPKESLKSLSPCRKASSRCRSRRRACTSGVPWTRWISV